LIDLHTHTTASDGKLPPAELVARAAEAGVRVLGIADHDTVGGCTAARAACDRAGIVFVDGIEITAVVDEADVHVLGYFVDIASASLQQFLAEQRQHRVDRIRQMVAKLAALGMPLDADEILQPGVDDASRSIGRPYIARALLAKGHVGSVSEAFEKWLTRGKPAFVPRIGASPEDVFDQIHKAGGLVSLAHPLLSKVDDRIPGYVEAGLDALEVYHSDHDAEATARYLALARSLGVLVTGGSDFHADEEHGGGGPGSVTLPEADYERLTARHAANRATASGSLTSS
jgi:predicted metal-dependent phosphoesterase TrpH